MLIARDLNPTAIITADIDFIRSAQSAGVRLVAISAGDEARELVSSVGIDERSGGRAIGKHLATLGHARIGFIKGPPEHRAAALRYDGFVDGLGECHVSKTPWAATGDFTFKSGVEAAEQLLFERPDVTAIACANDDMAAGVMLALHRAGRDIPRSISVTGFDDTPMSEIVWPPLTTIRQPIKELAERAVQMLVANWANEKVASDILPYELIVRESTASPGHSVTA